MVKKNRNQLEIMINNNEDITNICTNIITDMSFLFKDNQTFNQDISNWDVSNVSVMNKRFEDAANFDQDLSG